MAVHGHCVAGFESLAHLIHRITVLYHVHFIHNCLYAKYTHTVALNRMLATSYIHCYLLSTDACNATLLMCDSFGG